MDTIKLGDRLIHRKIITREQLDETLAWQEKLRKDGIDEKLTLLGLLLIKKGHISEKELIENMTDFQRTQRPSLKDNFQKGL